MRALGSRLSALEISQPDISPSVKHWLGQELTESEQSALDEGAGVDANFDSVSDYSSFSIQARKWPGL